MRLRVGLSLLVLVFCASRSASAAPVVVGTFNFAIEACDRDLDEFCEDNEYFSLTNNIDPSDPLYSALTWFGTVDLGGPPVDFFDLFGTGFLSAGESTQTMFQGLGFYFPDPATFATLTFSGGNFADYGSLFISNPLDANTSLARILLEPQPQPVPEPASVVLLATGLAVAALRRRRSRSLSH
jgi:hypothetical protein